jgi:hypothetical protein
VELKADRYRPLDCASPALKEDFAEWHPRHSFVGLVKACSVSSWNVDCAPEEDRSLRPQSRKGRGLGSRQAQTAMSLPGKETKDWAVMLFLATAARRQARLPLTEKEEEGFALAGAPRRGALGFPMAGQYETNLCCTACEFFPP